MSTKRSAAVFVVLAGACFSLSGPLARVARPTHPLLIAGARLAIAAIILGVIERRAIAEALRSLSWKLKGAVALAGALLAAHFACFQIGLDRTSLPAAISLVSLEPLAVVITAWALLGVRPSRAEGVGVVVATVGAVLVAQGEGKGDHRLAGDLIVLVAVALFGFYLTVARALKDALPARAYAAMVYGAASIALAPVLALTPDAFHAPRWPLTIDAVLAIAAIAVFPTVLGHTAVQTASRSLPPAIVALVSPGETLGGIAIGVMFLRAIPSGAEIAGALVILAGSSIAILAAPRALPTGAK